MNGLKFLKLVLIFCVFFLGCLPEKDHGEDRVPRFSQIEDFYADLNFIGSLSTRSERSRQAEDAIEEHVRNVAAFPLAIPLMAGPGAITATVLLASRSEGDPMRLAILLGVIAFVAALCATVFLLCTHVERLLGVTGNIVLSRLLGVLLAALAVQYVIDGVRAALA